MNILLACCLIVLVISACSAQAAPSPALTTTPARPETTATVPTVDLSGVLKQISVLSGWKSLEDAKYFSHDTLYDLMDGQSDSYFVYGFEQAGVQRFEPSGAPGVTVIVSVFQFSSPAGAFGLLTQNTGTQPIQIGNEGLENPGQRILFWQSRYFVQITALKAVPPETLRAAADAISQALPKGGARPSVVTALPEGAKEMRFFFQELSIQDSVWLGGENSLGLGMDTNGALASYTLNGADAWLMVVDFPEKSRAETAQKALQGGKVENVLASQVRGVRLAAVFGSVSKNDAANLIEKCFQNN